MIHALVNLLALGSLLSWTKWIERKHQEKPLEDRLIDFSIRTHHSLKLTWGGAKMAVRIFRAITKD